MGTRESEAESFASVVRCSAAEGADLNRSVVGDPNGDEERTCPGSMIESMSIETTVWVGENLSGLPVVCGLTDVGNTAVESNVSEGLIDSCREGVGVDHTGQGRVERMILTRGATGVWGW